MSISDDAYKPKQGSVEERYQIGHGLLSIQFCRLNRSSDRRSVAADEWWGKGWLDVCTARCWLCHHSRNELDGRCTGAQGGLESEDQVLRQFPHNKDMGSSADDLVAKSIYNVVA